MVAATILNSRKLLQVLYILTSAPQINWECYESDLERKYHVKTQSAQVAYFKMAAVVILISEEQCCNLLSFSTNLPKKLVGMWSPGC